MNLIFKFLDVKSFHSSCSVASVTPCSVMPLVLLGWLQLHSPQSACQCVYLVDLMCSMQLF